MNTNSEIRDLAEAEIDQITGASRIPVGYMSFGGGAAFIVYGPEGISGWIGNVVFSFGPNGGKVGFG